VTAFAAATAAAAGVGARSLALAAAILVGQMSIGWANDAVDAERDRRAGRRDKPVATGELGAPLVRRAASVALVADVPLSLLVGWRPGAAHLVAVGSAWLYDLRLKETAASPLPFAVSFGLLPVIIATAATGHPLPRAEIVAAAALMGVAAHFANTVGDVADDALTGVRGLPQRVGPTASVVVTGALLAAAAGLLVAAVGIRPLTVTAAVVDAGIAAVLPIALRGGARRHLAFTLVIVAVGVLVTAFVVDGGNRLFERH
jgi:4-hydroxybenzoate polyprenyltransferase